jgi:hypothetical protein
MICLFPSKKVVKYLMERKMAEVENDNVVARKINVGAGLQPAKVKVKGHSEQPCSESCFGAYSLEESRAIPLEESSASQIPSSQRRFSPLTKGESERDFLKSETPPQSSPEMGGNFSSYQEGQGEASSTPEFVAQN